MRDLLTEETQAKTLRPHQVKAIDLVKSSFLAGHKRTVLQAPTGFGKTVTAGSMIEGALAKGKNVLFTVPRISLVDQAVTEFEGQGIRHIGVIQANHPRTDDTASLQVASVDTLARRQIDFRPGLVIVDECHMKPNQTAAMMNAWPDVHFVGLSATPWAKGMGLVWQDLQIPITMQELIAQGFLSEFTVFAPYVPDMSGISTSTGDYNESETAEAMSEGKLVAGVVETWLAKGGNRPTLVFGVNCAHAQMLQQEFIKAGVAAGYCDAYTDRAAMQIYANRFRQGEYKVFCSVRKLTTGVDWAVSCIVDASPTKSEMLHVQKIGRGLRVNPGTEDCLILDHAGNSLRLGLVTDILHETLDKTVKGAQETKPAAEKLPKECANCGALHTGKVCPFCGHERTPQAGVETVDGELVELTGKKAAPTKAEKQEFWSMALHLDRNRGKGGKLAKALYRSKFGVWPQGLSDSMKHPDQVFMNYEKSRRIAYAAKMAKQGK
jgi:superfamily II DNA or RNA helicase